MVFPSIGFRLLALSLLCDDFHQEVAEETVARMTNTKAEIVEMYTGIAKESDHGQTLLVQASQNQLNVDHH